MGASLQAIGITSTIIFILFVSSYLFEDSYGEIISIPTSVTMTVERGKTVSMELLLRTKTNQTEINQYAPSLLKEETGLSVIPPSKVSVKLDGQLLKNTTLTRLNFTAGIPPEQRPGVYTGEIILLDKKGSSASIPVRITVVATPDYALIFQYLVYGAIGSAIWKGINQYREEESLKDQALLKAQNSLEAAVSKARLAASELPDVKSLTDPEAKREKILMHVNADADVIQARQDYKLAQNSHPLQRVVARFLAIGSGAVLAAILSFSQFLETTPNMSEAVFDGRLIAFVYGFGAHQALEHLIEQATKSIKKA